MRAVVRVIKARLVAANRIEMVDCAWCIEDNEKSKLAKMQVPTRLWQINNHGFHCSNHADQFHKFANLDQNMLFSCCDPEINAIDELTAMMGKMNLED